MLICRECGSPNLNKNGGRRVICVDCGSAKNPIDTEEAAKASELAKKVQKFQDTNRIERKTFREHARISNALEIYSQELVKILKTHPVKKFKKKHNPISDTTLFVQLSDLHFNELVSLSNNRYDFKIASSRLKEFARRIKIYAHASKCSRVVVLMTGDFLNSDRRLDEMLNQATNRAQATFLGYLILRHFLNDIASIGQTDCYFVTGNESRIKDEMGFSKVTASDNYDVTIFHMLKIAFETSDRVSFHEGDPSEQVIKIGDEYFLLMHGTTMGTGNTQGKITQIVGKYALKGIKLRYVFYGHVHSSHISDWYARSSSLTGSNTYNENALHLIGRAAQNIFFYHGDGILDSIKIDLQGEFGEGYEIDSELEAYNVKSADKIKTHETIFKVVI